MRSPTCHLDTSHLGSLWHLKEGIVGIGMFWYHQKCMFGFCSCLLVSDLSSQRPCNPLLPYSRKKSYSDIYYCLLQFRICMEYVLMFQYMHPLYIDQIKVASLSTTYPSHFFVMRTSTLLSSYCEMYHVLCQSSPKTFVIYWMIRTCDTALLNPLEFLGWDKHLLSGGLRMGAGCQKNQSCN